MMPLLDWTVCCTSDAGSAVAAGAAVVGLAADAAVASLRLSTFFEGSILTSFIFI